MACRVHECFLALGAEVSFAMCWGYDFSLDAGAEASVWIVMCRAGEVLLSPGGDASLGTTMRWAMGCLRPLVAEVLPRGGARRAACQLSGRGGWQGPGEGRSRARPQWRPGRPGPRAGGGRRPKGSTRQLLSRSAHGRGLTRKLPPPRPARGRKLPRPGASPPGEALLPAPTPSLEAPCPWRLVLRGLARKSQLAPASWHDQASVTLR